MSGHAVSRVIDGARGEAEGRPSPSCREDDPLALIKASGIQEQDGVGQRLQETDRAGLAVAMRGDALGEIQAGDEQEAQGPSTDSSATAMRAAGWTRSARSKGSMTEVPPGCFGRRFRRTFGKGVGARAFRVAGRKGRRGGRGGKAPLPRFAERAPRLRGTQPNLGRARSAYRGRRRVSGKRSVPASAPCGTGAAAKRFLTYEHLEFILDALFGMIRACGTRATRWSGHGSRATMPVDGRARLPPLRPWRPSPAPTRWFGREDDVARLTDALVERGRTRGGGAGAGGDRQDHADAAGGDGSAGRRAVPAKGLRGAGHGDDGGCGGGGDPRDPRAGPGADPRCGAGAAARGADAAGARQPRNPVERGWRGDRGGARAAGGRVGCGDARLDARGAGAGGTAMGRASRGTAAAGRWGGDVPRPGAADRGG